MRVLAIVAAEGEISMRFTMQSAARSAVFVLAAVVVTTGASRAQSDSEPAAAGVMSTFLVAGALDPNGKVPALNAVPGAGVPNVAVAFPTVVLTHGTQYAYTLGSQNTTYSGSCADTYKLTQVESGKTVTLDSGTIGSSYDCAVGDSFYWYTYGKPVPNKPGLATLTGTIAYGTNKVSKKLTVLIK
jgi:hypothetical protein